MTRTGFHYAQQALVAATLFSVSRLLFVGFLNAPASRAQDAAASFEVASVKENRSADRRWTGFDFKPGGLAANNLTLATLIAIAYDVPFMGDRVTGGPKWAREDRYDVQAKASFPDGLSVRARETQTKLMLRTLLAERFHLVLRRETRQMAIYSLTVAKGGPKLKEASVQEDGCGDGPDRCHVLNGGMGRGLHGKAVDMRDIVTFAGNWTDRPLIDNTGLSGLYEIDTDGWSPMRQRVPSPDGATREDALVNDPDRPTLFMIFARLGLKLSAVKGDADVFIIQQAERPDSN